ncbi:cyclic nucleotide-binding domain-containing protein [Bdellovibrio sp. HCB209]|uniref:cyclic nucleotide-binding domain-containing protein n=1 Tax=Bdellovibrio sp. HCB209 TaxID=3394354 RepID=UPI0039B36C26
MGRSQDKNTFLIVSGDPNRITAISDVLNKHFANCSIFHGADWFGAKYKIDNVRPKIIFIDEYLPKGSGYDIIAKVLKEKNNSDIFMVMMSYVPDHDMFPQEVQSGRLSFLSEPNREWALLEVVSKIIAPKPTKEGSQYKLRSLTVGETLFKEGDNTEVVYIVKHGTLSAYSSEAITGSRVTLGEIGPGEFVGEMGHFNHEPRSATVEAVTEVELIEIPMSALESVIFSKPSWAKALVKTLSLRLKRANKALTG